MADTVAPYRHPDDGHRRHGKRLSIENGGHHLAAVPFYFLLVVGHTLSGRQHIVNDNDFFSLYITGNLVIPLPSASCRLSRASQITVSYSPDVRSGLCLPIYQFSRLNRCSYFIQLLHGMNMI